MKDRKKKPGKINDERMEAFSSLPPAIRNSLTPEEKEIFLNSDEWPETLCEKLSEFLFKMK
jgi:hypothetical protein